MWLASDNFNKIKQRTHIYWKDHFHKSPLHFTVIADFEADNEIEDGKFVGNKLTSVINFPVLKGYNKKSELENVLKNGYYETPFGYDNVDC